MFSTLVFFKILYVCFLWIGKHKNHIWFLQQRVLQSDAPMQSQTQIFISIIFSLTFPSQNLLVIMPLPLDSCRSTRFLLVRVKSPKSKIFLLKFSKIKDLQYLGFYVLFCYFKATKLWSFWNQTIHEGN